MRALRRMLMERCGGRCEGTPQFPNCPAVNRRPHPETGSIVVLTLAHMDWDETHADLERCRMLCQRCHNNWDAAHRRANAAKTRRAKKASGDLLD